MTQAQTITVRILDKDYHIACPAEHNDNLQRAANYLDQKMREIRRNGKVVGAERIAVMAALNITYELHNIQQAASMDSNSAEQISQLLAQVQNTLAADE